MNILLIVVGVIAGLTVLLLVVALFTKKSYSISRSMMVEQPCEVVYDYVKFLRNQDYFSKWVMMDPSMKKDYRGTDGTPGFVYAWDSKNKNAGKGEQEIVNLKPNERIDVQIRFERPFEGVSDTWMLTERAANHSTKVSWVFNSSMKYPMNAAMLFMDFDKILGADMETSLSRLKTILEEKKISA